MTFEFATAGRILFGRGKSQQIPTLARDLGRRALVVLGGSSRGCQALTEGLSDAGVRPVVFNVSGEPTTHLVDQATGIARSEGCDVVISVGGGSVIDAGKAVAALLANPGEVRDYLELAGGGKPLLERGMPFVAVPTTAGTGSEVTRNAVLDVPEHKVKASLRSPHLLARLAVVDPDLTLSLPPTITAYTGMDALTQLIEPFASNAANPLTDGVCREGLTRAARSLARAYRDGSDVAAREDMALASLFGGIALANARLGAVHGFASVLGGTTGHAHGAICAAPPLRHGGQHPRSQRTGRSDHHPTVYRNRPGLDRRPRGRRLGRSLLGARALRRDEHPAPGGGWSVPHRLRTAHPARPARQQHAG